MLTCIALHLVALAASLQAAESAIPPSVAAAPDTPACVAASHISLPSSPDTIPFDTLRALRRQLEQVARLPLRSIPVGTPGLGAMNPTAFTGNTTTLGIGVGFQKRSRYTRNPDATMGISLGYGNPIKSVRAHLGIAILDMSRRGDGAFGKRGSMNFRLSRRFPRGYSGAVGLENAFVWGYSDVPTSTYMLVSNTLPLRRDAAAPLGRLFWSLGLGTGRYLAEQDARWGKGGINAFGSVAVNVAPPVNVFMEWSGQDASAGMSISPFATLPFVANVAITDITGSAGDGARLVIGAGYSITFGKHVIR